MFALSLSPSQTPRSYGDRQPIEMHRHLEQNDRSETDVNSQHKVKSFLDIWMQKCCILYIFKLLQSLSQSLIFSSGPILQILYTVSDNKRVITVHYGIEKGSAIKEPFEQRVYPASEGKAASNEQSKQITCQPAGPLSTRHYLCLHYLIAYDLNESGQRKWFWRNFAMTQPLFTDKGRESIGEGTR